MTLLASMTSGRRWCNKVAMLYTFDILLHFPVQIEINHSGLIGLSGNGCVSASVPSWRWLVKWRKRILWRCVGGVRHIPVPALCWLSHFNLTLYHFAIVQSVQLPPICPMTLHFNKILSLPWCFYWGRLTDIKAKLNPSVNNLMDYVLPSSA